MQTTGDEFWSDLEKWLREEGGLSQQQVRESEEEAAPPRRTFDFLIMQATAVSSELQQQHAGVVNGSSLDAIEQLASSLLGYDESVEE